MVRSGQLLNSTDVFVIGGGPAGLAAAIAARQQGFRVVVADGAKPPIDKACGEALMPDAITALERLGVAVPAAEACPIRGVRFLSSGLSAEADFPSGNPEPLRSPDRIASRHDRTCCRAGGRSAVAERSYGNFRRGRPSRGSLDPHPVDCRSRWRQLTRAPLGESRCRSRERASDMPFASIIASRPGPTAWKSIGESTVSAMPHR